MRIITHTCPNCGTVVAANILEENPVTKCPRLGCEETLRFEDLSDEEQQYIAQNRDEYRL